MDDDITDLGSPENTERDINPCTSQCPYLTVEISKPAHRFSIDSKNEVFRL
jgi:hypothetical protein